MKKETEIQRIRKRYLKEIVCQSRKWLVMAGIAMLILSIYNIVISWLLQTIIDIVSGDSSMTILQVGIIAMITFLIFIAAYVIYRVARPKYLYQAMLCYKQKIFCKMIDKNLSSFRKENTSQYLSMYTNDAKMIEMYYFDSVLEMIDLTVSFVGALLLMLWYSPILTVFGLILSVLPIAASLPIANKMAEAERKVSDGNGEFVSIVRDILQGFPVIKSFQAEKEMKKNFFRENERMEHLKYQSRYIEESINLWGTAASVMMRLGIFLIGAWMSVSGYGVTPGIVLVFLQLMNYVISPIERIPSILAKRKAAIGLIEKMLVSVQINQEQMEENKIGMLKKGISLKDVSVSIGNKNVLHHLNFEFEIGKKYAVVGSSGAGKSTLINTIMGGFSPVQGEVLFDGIDSREIQPESLFQVMALVQQSVFVFRDTIRNNITLFKEFDEEKVKKAADQAGLRELIDKRGLNDSCGENGNKLSGGERQRIAIARALLRGSQVLLLDEATAALDNQTSYAVIDAVLSMKEMTEIIVTHRLEEKLLYQYDEILVMHAGEIVEKGTFQELMQKKGFFYSLYVVSKE
ncbi:ABC transporter ATP-binding protein/permease [[Ruminococcus] gnavus]|uniref:ABC transporter ATP-binding protein n=1 Tax=Mediterraneibacter gnavus TaxID=33038 RepID=UPI00210EEA50|nr:ABC transporter ATP-binding protein [Mediterraneibacter gnavus]MCQ4700816.1 ABC transporter ATP-binding protein/permease [Mediterraneibacter gnavus]